MGGVSANRAFAAAAAHASAIRTAHRAEIADSPKAGAPVLRSAPRAGANRSFAPSGAAEFAIRAAPAPRVHRCNANRPNPGARAPSDPQIRAPAVRRCDANRANQARPPPDPRSAPPPGANRGFAAGPVAESAIHAARRRKSPVRPGGAAEFAIRAAARRGRISRSAIRAPPNQRRRCAATRVLAAMRIRDHCRPRPGSPHRCRGTMRTQRSAAHRSP